eukprot:TRINITY_DN1119_c0_g1_i10.p1 TRINITY_DN1119_c0_g1~~TRINITY_DN1119_c0_g1_i10.p1  ORF type:complete len:241 (-),score=5.78 TRINITY_DN1119_c0_g1_i10:126-848(-)
MHCIAFIRILLLGDAQLSIIHFRTTSRSLGTLKFFSQRRRQKFKAVIASSRTFSSVTAGLKLDINPDNILSTCASEREEISSQMYHRVSREETLYSSTSLCELVARLSMISSHWCLGSSRRAMAETACAAPLRALLYTDAKVPSANLFTVSRWSSGIDSHRPLNGGSYCVGLKATLERSVFLNRTEARRRAFSGIDSLANICERTHTNLAYSENDHYRILISEFANLVFGRLSQYVVYMH